MSVQVAASIQNVMGPGGYYSDGGATVGLCVDGVTVWSAPLECEASTNVSKVVAVNPGSLVDIRILSRGARLYLVSVTGFTLGADDAFADDEGW